MTSRIVIAIDLASQSGLAVLAVYGAGFSTRMSDKSTHNRLVDSALDRCGYGNGYGHVHKSPNRAN